MASNFEESGSDSTMLNATSFKSIALATMLVRDVLGYLFIGIGFWAFLIWLGSLPLSGGVAPTDLQFAGLAMVLGYPTGRFLYYVGEMIRSLIPALSWKRLMPSAYREFKQDSKVETEELKPFGIPFSEENASLVCGRLLPRKIFIDNPPLYFLYIARTNTLRILAETMLGFVAVASGFYLANGSNWGDWWKWLQCASVILICGLSVFDTRRDQARTEVLTCWYFLKDEHL